MGKGDKFFNSPFGPTDIKNPKGTPRRPRIRVYTAPNRLLVSENGWPFRRFGGGAGSGGGAPRPSRARLCAPTNASPSRPDPPTLIRRRLVASDHRRPRQAALQRRKTAEKRLKETGKALLPREAAHRRQQGRSTRRSGPARPIPGRAGAVSLTRRACDQPAPSQMRVGQRGGEVGWGQIGQPEPWAAGAMGRRPAVARGRGQARAGGRAAAGRRAARRAPAAPPGRPRARGSCRCRWAPAGAGRGVGGGIGGGRPSRLGRRGRSKPRATYALGPQGYGAHEKVAIGDQRQHGRHPPQRHLQPGHTYPYVFSSSSDDFIARAPFSG